VLQGHEVLLSSREAGNAKAAEWAAAQGGATRARAGTFAEAAAFGELIILAVKGDAAVQAVQQTGGAAPFRGKVVIDATNPLAFGPPNGVELALGPAGESTLEQLQVLLPEARLVKAFNTINCRNFYQPSFPHPGVAMHLAGDDATAKQAVRDILVSFGWGQNGTVIVDAGNRRAARDLEYLALLFVKRGIATKDWTLGIAYQQRPPRATD
jgi:8-hydroxy-5-deazaflavin:NADPH oxidoreductase